MPAPSKERSRRVLSMIQGSFKIIKNGAIGRGKHRCRAASLTLQFFHVVAIDASCSRPSSEITSRTMPGGFFLNGNRGNR